jgi:hypothetical protein
MERPEVSTNKYRVSTKLGIDGRAEVSLANTDINSFGNGNPQLTPEVEDTGYYPFATIAMTIQPKLELSYRLHEDNKLSIKYQVRGDGADVARAGNLSQAVSAGISLFQDDNEYSKMSQSADYSLDPIIHTYTEDSGSWEQKTYAIDLAWIFGYRLIDNVLIYGGPFLVYGDLIGEQAYQTRIADNPEFNNATLQHNTLSLDSSGHLLGANVAIEYMFDFGLFFTLEYSAAQLKWEGDSNADANFGLAIGYQF